MDVLKKIFFPAFHFTGETGKFVLGIIIHVAIMTVVPFIIGGLVGLLTCGAGAALAVPVGAICGLYGTAGLVFNILVQTKVIKE